MIRKPKFDLDLPLTHVWKDDYSVEEVIIPINREELVVLEESMYRSYGICDFLDLEKPNVKIRSGLKLIKQKLVTNANYDEQLKEYNKAKLDYEQSLTEWNKNIIKERDKEAYQTYLRLKDRFENGGSIHINPLKEEEIQ